MPGELIETPSRSPVVAGRTGAVDLVKVGFRRLSERNAAGGSGVVRSARLDLVPELAGFRLVVREEDTLPLMLDVPAPPLLKPRSFTGSGHRISAIAGHSLF